jgi:hypothetical protein
VVADTPEGPVKIRFTERNDFGILDHHVVVRPGVDIYIPMRVIANGTGSEVIFTLFRLPDMTDEACVGRSAPVVIVTSSRARPKSVRQSKRRFGISA